MNTRWQLRMRSISDKVLLALCILIIVWAVFQLSGCSKPEDKAHVAQVEAEKRLRDALVLVTR
jgi:hypothetical protein